MLVGRVVVYDQMQLLVFGGGIVNQSQKAKPFLMPMTLLAEADYFAIQGIESSEQGSCTVALVIVRHRSSPATLQRQAGLCTVQSLNLAFLVATQNQSVFRWIQVQPHDGFQFLGKVGIFADFESFPQMGLQAMLVPNASHGGFAELDCRGHPARGPMCRIGRFLLRGDLYHTL